MFAYFNPSKIVEKPIYIEKIVEKPREILVEEEEAQDEELKLNFDLSNQRIRELEQEKIALEKELALLRATNIGSMMIQNTNIDYTAACAALRAQNDKLRTQIRQAQMGKSISASQIPSGIYSPRRQQLMAHLDKLRVENSQLRQQMVV